MVKQTYNKVTFSPFFKYTVIDLQGTHIKITLRSQFVSTIQ